jgi:4'-phosphopantetheinyl transferase
MQTVQPTNRTLYPVILRVAEEAQKLSGRQQVQNLSRLARSALKRSARKGGLTVREFLKNENGAPLPSDGIYWSVTHKPEYVAGVVAVADVGIDVEKIRPCSPGLFKRTAVDEEWCLAPGSPSFELFFRYWTAKEAVIKAMGTGLRDLLKCRVDRILDPTHLSIVCRETHWYIEHFFFDGHVAAITKNSFETKWTVVS